MAVSINSLPYELISEILDYAAFFNSTAAQQYTYGLQTSIDSLREKQDSKSRGQLTLRGHTAPDAFRWIITSTIRQTSRQWRDWALAYSVRELYIRRWRGSERWIQSRNLGTIKGFPSNDVVYRDPYYSLRDTSTLFDHACSIASNVRRLWFEGFHNAETVTVIFNIVRHCTALQSVTLPWTALRHGDADDWSTLLGDVRQGRSLETLELLAVDVKSFEMAESLKNMNKKPLDLSKVNFGGLKRLKLSGSSNLMPIKDEGLSAMSRTATNLHELHITGTTAISTDGLFAIMRASKNTLQVVEHSPLSDDGFRHPESLNQSNGDHLCDNILECRRLSSLAISLPSICECLFSDLSVKWTGDVQIRAGNVCSDCNCQTQATEASYIGQRILTQARCLMNARAQEDVELNIEIFIDRWIFEPQHWLVHGDVALGETLSDGLWPASKAPSCKGPYGQTGLYGKDERPYSSISEEDFLEGVRRGYISLKSNL